MPLKEGIRMSYINEIFVMDDIFSLEQEVEQLYGIPILNISHWDSSNEFQKHMMGALVLPYQSLPWNYYYTYSISMKDRRQILKNLGVPTKHLTSSMGLLLQSSTIAIVNMINLLVHFKYKRLCILQPAYFSVAPCCSMLSLEYGTEKILFRNNHPQIPIDAIISGGYDCVWITSPIFCTGYYLDNENIRDINYLKSIGITLILDESLALPGKELVRSLPISKELFAIYSPHKSISINGLKFAVVVCHKYYEDFLEQWIDIFSGALASSNRDAVFHYLSPNYIKNCYPAYQSYIMQTKNLISSVVDKYAFASMLPNTEGHYVTIFTDIKIQENELLYLMKDIIYNCLASFIPSTLNGFDFSQGLSFRVNLTAHTYDLKEAVSKIMQYLNSRYH